MSFGVWYLACSCLLIVFYLGGLLIVGDCIVCTYVWYFGMFLRGWFGLMLIWVVIVCFALLWLSCWLFVGLDWLLFVLLLIRFVNYIVTLLITVCVYDSCWLILWLDGVCGWFCCFRADGLGCVLFVIRTLILASLVAGDCLLLVYG